MLHICEIRLKGWSQKVIMVRTQMLQELKKEGLYCVHFIDDGGE